MPPILNSILPQQKEERERVSVHSLSVVWKNVSDGTKLGGVIPKTLPKQQVDKYGSKYAHLYKRKY